MQLGNSMSRLAASAGAAVIALTAFQAAATDTKVALVPGAAPTPISPPGNRRARMPRSNSTLPAPIIASRRPGS